MVVVEVVVVAWRPAAHGTARVTSPAHTGGTEDARKQVLFLCPAR